MKSELEHQKTEAFGFPHRIDRRAVTVTSISLGRVKINHANSPTFLCAYILAPAVYVGDPLALVKVETKIDDCAAACLWGGADRGGTGRVCQTPKTLRGEDRSPPDEKESEEALKR